MTREQLLALGFTEEQVNQIMALHGQATQGLNATIQQNTATITRLTGELEQARNANPNPPEPPEPDNPELTNALNRIRELENENRRKDIATYATSKNLSGEQVESILAALGDDVERANKAIDSIAQIISDADKTARDDEKQKLLKGTPNPDGGKGGDDKKTSAEKIATKFFGEQKQETDILSHYI